MTIGQTELATVDQATGEITEIQKTPNELLLHAREAARALEGVITSNERPPVMFNGKRFLEYPHWQTIAKFYHCTVSTDGVEFIDICGVQGFKAKAKVIDETNGLCVGQAEAYCMKDERNWKDKPMFQLASMAQTRAGAKALSNKFRFVAIVAGYEPTPSEEMTGDEKSFQRIQQPRAKTDSLASPEQSIGLDRAPLGDETDGHAIEFPSKAPPENKQVEAVKKVFGKENKLVTDRQRKMLFAIMKQVNMPENVLREYIETHFDTQHTSELTMAQFDLVLGWVNKYGNKHDGTGN